ncbi:MAG: hypothetical protein CVV27_03760 [Candidatus Melainabacteria bacterium HGW-Melainabacteria-1]|nr:MAG: hypothetical protein CVV27_03760 [Candidatus Melainabacteria bacterium HGW-Melainabacteria-1]
MFFKLLTLGVVIGVGAYYYDLNTAKKVTRDAQYASRETETRCRNNHETMCQYFLTVKLERPEPLTYKFRVPMMYYHQIPIEEIKNRRYPVTYKEKKIFPATITGLAPKFQEEIDAALAKEK